MSKYCTKCGTELSEEALFCHSCGTPQKIPAVQPDITGSAEPNIPTKTAMSDMQAPHLTSSISIATFFRKHKKILLICGMITVVVAVILFLILGNISTDADRDTTSEKVTFLGLEKTDSVNTVKRKLGKPDNFVDNGSQNISYYYGDIEFLNITGTVAIHFSSNMVYEITFDCDTREGYSVDMSNYEDVIDYYTRKYGEPSSQDSYFSSYYGMGSECAVWELDKGLRLEVEFQTLEWYSGYKLTIRIH